jgi:UDPglucose--hexose-1-phosphate uridylyltransferase
MIKAGKRQTATDQPDTPTHLKDHTAESRLDQLTGNWTIFAPDRDQRPEEFVHHKEVLNKQVECPFCPGNERTTPPAVWIGRISDDDSSTDILDPANFGPSEDDWSVRVVPNKFPAVEPVDARVATNLPSAHFQRGPIRGGHEVIVESRNHVQSLSQLDLAELYLVFQAFRDRLRYWRSVKAIQYISAFKNVGEKAGASLRHTHSQLIAAEKMPTAIQSSIQRMIHHRAATGCCLQCDLIRAELKAEHRVIWSDDSLVAYCPFASRLPMLVQITTLGHQACYEDLDHPVIESVSRLVGRVVSWLEKLRPGTAYNFCLHTRPPGAMDPPDSFHWSIEIFPRMTQIAGFEWSSGCMINPVLPEAAAAKYRACARAEDPRVML